jgi:hypothetical protein
MAGCGTRPHDHRQMSHALEVSRTGLWIRQGGRFICLDKFDARYDAHSSARFSALKSSRRTMRP